MGKRRRDTTTTALMAIAAVVWVVAAFFALRGRPADETPSPTTEDRTGAPSSGAASTGSASPTTASSGAPSAAASAKPPTQSPSACISAALATDGIDYDFVCAQENPLKASGKIKSALVRNGKGLVTDAMRQWAGLGWYEMAAFATLRAHCCPAGEPLAYNFVLACPLDEAINELDAAVRAGKRETIDAAIKRYGKEARCLDQFGQSRNMGRDGPPGAGVASLRRLLDTMFGAAE